jgi:hypothetical protein
MYEVTGLAFDDWGYTCLEDLTIHIYVVTETDRYGILVTRGEEEIFDLYMERDLQLHYKERELLVWQQFMGSL